MENEGKLLVSSFFSTHHKLNCVVSDDIRINQGMIALVQLLSITVSQCNLICIITKDVNLKF